MEQKTLGTLIAELRKRCSMTQKQLAEKLNVSDKTISRWERDETAPDLSLIPEIADLFGITCDDLLRGKESVTPPMDDAPPIRLDSRTYTAITYGLIMLGLIAASVCYLGLGYRYGVLGFCLELAFCVAASICQTIGYLRSPSPESRDSSLNAAIVPLSLLAGSALIMNSSLDIAEVMLLGVPLAFFVALCGFLLKWFLISPTADEKLHSLRNSFACNITIALITTFIIAFLFCAGTGGEGGLVLGLILTPIEIFIALAIYLHDKKKGTKQYA